MKSAKRKPSKPILPPIGHLKAEIAMDEVDNPLFMPDHDVSRTNPLRVKAVINIRESPIGLLAHRGIINKAQVKAASHFRGLYERMGASIAAMDYSRDPVDGGGVSDPISARQMEAGIELKRVRQFVGPRHYDVLVKVIGQGIEISALGKTRRERDTYADYLKHGLEDLSGFWGYQTNNYRYDRSA